MACYCSVSVAFTKGIEGFVELSYFVGNALLMEIYM